jgi:hypothetical protein
MTVMSDAGDVELAYALAWVRHWQGTTGVAHEDARIEAQAAIARWRRYHAGPANARYAAAVAASKVKRRVA